jgi:hypothetical protein
VTDEVATIRRRIRSADPDLRAAHAIIYETVCSPGPLDSYNRQKLLRRLARELRDAEARGAMKERAAMKKMRFEIMGQCADIANDVAEKHDATSPERGQGAALAALAILKAARQ